MAALLLCSASALALEPDDLLVIASRRFDGSEAIARVYVAARHVPTNRLVLLDLPDTEVISRSAYNQQLRDPVRAALSAYGSAASNRIEALVLVRGVPLHIAPTSVLTEQLHELVDGSSDTDQAAVDSELSLVLAGDYPLKGRVMNPAYERLQWTDHASASCKLLIVTRLDGPSADQVRGMIRDAVEVESNGLQGRVYFDLRRARRDGYQQGDYWLEEDAERFLRDGYECVIDRNDGVFGASYPMDEVAGYFGWYTRQATGPFQRPDFHMRKGAIAYHLHSTSARSLRNEREFWCAPLLAHGACATMGATAEPYLQFTPNLQVFADRLLRGVSFGESAYLSLPALSWQITVIGDPLYRPYARASSLAEPAPLDATSSDWEIVRAANLMVRAGRYNSALSLLRLHLRDRRTSAVLYEKIGDLYALGELPAEAARAYAAGVGATASGDAAVRLCVKAKNAYAAIGPAAAGKALEDEVRKRWAGHPCLPTLGGATAP